MPRRKLLTDEGVGKLKARKERYAEKDPEQTNHYIRVSPSGYKSFVVAVRGPEKDDKGKLKLRWETIGEWPTFDIETARERARTILRAVKDGKSAPESFEKVAAKFRELHCEARKLRSLSEIDRFLKRMAYAWTGREFASIGRGDVSKLLDKIESENGPRQATYCLQVFSALANWYAARDDDYRSPIVKGMRRGSPIKRDRTLTDDELRAVWSVANGTFGSLVRLLLLTGQRREKVASMRWEDISIDGTWTIPTEAREKGNAGLLVLPALALDIIKSQPRFESNPYIFASRVGGGHINGWSIAKRQFDSKLTDVAPWTLHDLRRTARSLMSRAGVRPDISERVLGHAIHGVEGVYDRHRYSEEKAHALKALAGLIENILRPADNVRPLARAR